MNSAKPDRRVQRTRRQLSDALMQLILERGYDTIKVEDITDRADLGRTTFYLHYRDKEELLLDSIGLIVEELKTRVLDAWQQRWLNAQPGSGPQPVVLIFQHAAENSLLYRIILSGGAAKHVNDRIRTFIEQEAARFFTQNRELLRLQESELVPFDVITAYFASSLLGLLTWWLEKGMPYPPEQMAEMFLRLFFAGPPGMATPKRFSAVSPSS